MTDTNRRILTWFAISGAFISILISILIVVACAGAAWLVSEEPLDREHEELIENLRRGSFSTLDDIYPAPNGVFSREEVSGPPPGMKYRLDYTIKRSRPWASGWRALEIFVDKDLRLISYRVHDD